MRTQLMVFVVVLLIGAVGMVYSDSKEDESHGRSVEEVLEEIREAQGLDSGDRIDPDLVSEHMLEELGKAVMSLMHPDAREHEAMDEMMGGEGSESLAAMHRAMGYGYPRAGMAGGVIGAIIGLVVGLIMTALYGITLLAIAEGIQVFLDIEENTREIARRIKELPGVTAPSPGTPE